jgi:hypothetical protein
MVSERGLGKDIGMGSRKMVSTGSRETVSEWNLRK